MHYSAFKYSIRRLVAGIAVLLCSASNATAQFDPDPIYGEWDILLGFVSESSDCLTYSRSYYGGPPYGTPFYWYRPLPNGPIHLTSSAFEMDAFYVGPQLPASVPIVVTELGGTGSTSHVFDDAVERGQVTATVEVSFNNVVIGAGKTDATVVLTTTVTGCTGCSQDPQDESYTPIPCTGTQTYNGFHWFTPSAPPPPPPPGGGDEGECAKRITGTIARGELRCKVVGKKGRKISGAPVRFEVQAVGEDAFATASTAVSDAKGKVRFPLAGHEVGDRVRCTVVGCNGDVSSRPRVIKRAP
jgi:hypothetical protein